MRFIVSSFANAAMWSQLLQRTRKPIEIDRTPSRTWPLSCGEQQAKGGTRSEESKERKKKKRKRGSRGEARFTGDVSRWPPFPCTREFNRG